MYKLQTAEAHVRQRTLPGTDASRLSSTFVAKPNVRVDTTGLIKIGSVSQASSQSGRRQGESEAAHKTPVATPISLLVLIRA